MMVGWSQCNFFSKEFALVQKTLIGTLTCEPHSQKHGHVLSGWNSGQFVLVIACHFLGVEDGILPISSHGSGWRILKLCASSRKCSMSSTTIIQFCHIFPGWWGGGFSTQYSHFLDSCCSSASRHRGTHHLPSSVHASIVHHGTMYCSVLPHAQMLSNFFMMPNTTDTITPLTITLAAR